MPAAAAPACSVVPASSSACAPLAASTTAASIFLPLSSFSRRGTAFSRVCRSASISSVWMISMSSAGSIVPATWMTSSSAKSRTTWQIASASRMLARNWLPRPSPSLAPFTMPAMSTNDTVAGTVCALPEIAGEDVEARVGERDDADVRLDRGERVVRREHVGLGQRVEEGGLADVGQADDPDRECHRRANLGGSTADDGLGGAWPSGFSRATVKHLVPVFPVRAGRAGRSGFIHSRPSGATGTRTSRARSGSRTCRAGRGRRPGRRRSSPCRRPPGRR